MHPLKNVTKVNLFVSKPAIVSHGNNKRLLNVTAKNRNSPTRKSERANDAAAACVAIRNHRRTLQADYQKFLKDRLLEIYEIALDLALNPKAWVAFCGYIDWETFRLPPKPEKPETALQYTLRLAAGFNTKDTKFVSRYYRILKPFFDDRVPTEKVAKMARKAGGISRLRASSSMDAVKQARDLLSEGGLEKQLEKAQRHFKRDIPRLAQRLKLEQFKTLVNAFTLAIWLLENSDAWEEFCRLETWRLSSRKPHVDRPHQAFEFLLKLIYRNSPHREVQNMRVLSRLMQGLWDAFIAARPSRF